MTRLFDCFRFDQAALSEIAQRLQSPLTQHSRGVFGDGAEDATHTARVVRRGQTGYLYHYAFAMILGLIASLAVLIRYWR